MGALLESSTGRRLLLRSRHRLGRGPNNHTILAHGSVSGDHAVLEFQRGCWFLRDLGSRNGTTVNGLPIGGGASQALSVGARIHLGGDPAALVLVEDDPPCAFALGPGGLERVGGLDWLSLDEEAPASIYRDDQGQWVLEEGGKHLVVEDGAMVVVGAREWHLHLPVEISPTVDLGVGPTYMHDLRFCFSVSADQEHIQLVVTHGARTWDLGARSAHYHLLQLARIRLEEEALPGIPTEEAGWVLLDDLLDMLKCSENQVNVYVHRARTQLAGIGVVGASGVVERRQGQRMLRFGSTKVELLEVEVRAI